MKWKLIYVGTLTFLVLLNWYILHQYKVNREEYKTDLVKMLFQKKADSLNVFNLKQQILLQYQLSIQADNNFFRANYSKWKGKTKIVVLFKEGQCASCILRILADFSIIEQLTGFNDFVIMGIFENKEKFNQFANQFDYEYYSHEFISSKTKISEYLEYPTVLILNKELVVNSIYIPDLLPEFREQYFFNIVPMYLTGK